MKTHHLCSSILFLSLLFITGCGHVTPSQMVASPAPSAATTISATEQTTGIPAEDTLQVSHYIPLEIDESELDELDEDGNSGYYYLNSQTTTHLTFGQKYYTLIHNHMKKPKESTLWMHVYDMDTYSMEKIQLTPQVPEFESYIIDSVKLISPQKLAYKIYGKPVDSEGYYFLLETDMDGNALNIIEPFPDSETYPWFQQHNSTTHIFGTGSDLFFIKEWNEAQETTKLYSYVPQTGERTLIDSLPEYLNKPYTIDNENIYYINNCNLKKYNIHDKTTELLCNITDLGLPTTDANSCNILINEAGDLALVAPNSEEGGIYYLAMGQPTNTEKSLVSFSNISIYDPVYTRRQAAAFSARSLTCSVQYESMNEQYLDAYRDRMIMQLVSGKGPDLLWVSREDMEMLAEKDVLMDLSELLSDDIKAQLFPGILQAGTIDDKLVGITPEVAFTTMVTSNQVWSEESWTVSDVLQAANTKEDWQVPFFFNFLTADCYTLFYGVLAKDWTNSPFLDMEQGISYFNTAEFTDTLKLCKKYGRTGMISYDTDTVVRMLRDGNTVAQMRYLYEGIHSFSTLMKQNGEDCHIVGFPTEGTSGNYLFSDGYLVVNAASTHKEEIAAFITHLLDYKNQFTVNYTSVRRDVIADCIQSDEFTGQIYQKKAANGQSLIPIEAKSDSTSYLKEFIAFYESCQPQPRQPSDITTILGEEFSYYFGGGKSAEEVAEIIHQRVQLYFDETK